jgi:hypothetical protein
MGYDFTLGRVVAKVYEIGERASRYSLNTFPVVNHSKEMRERRAHAPRKLLSTPSRTGARTLYTLYAVQAKSRKIWLRGSSCRREWAVTPGAAVTSMLQPMIRRHHKSLPPPVFLQRRAHNPPKRGPKSVRADKAQIVHVRF